jgi:hypothetical protein
MVAVGLLGLLTPGASPVWADDAPSEYQVKAAFLLNFARFVEWPATAFSTASEPFVIGIVGMDPFGGAMDQVVSGKTVNGRPIAVRRVSDPAALRACHVVFFATSDPRRLNEIAGPATSPGILTVGEAEGFAERGGMINFVVENNHVRFEINPAAASRAGLKISSKLLQLAIIVRDATKGK